MASSSRVPLPRKAKATAPAPSNAPAKPSLVSIYFARYKEATWIPIGREQEEVEAANSVTYSQTSSTSPGQHF